MTRAAWCVVALLAAFPAAGWAQLTVEANAMSDPGIAGVAAVNTAADLLKSQNPDAAIGYLTDALNSARNAAVQRAIRFQLVDFYKQAGRPDKALEVLKDLIASIPPQPLPQVVQLVPAEATTTTSGTAPQQ